MDLLEHIRAFAQVAQSGSFSAAARELGSTQPSVSKQIAALEKHCGVRLLQRTTRQLRLTEDGAAYLTLARRILDSVAEADAHIGRVKGEPIGLVRIGSPYAFATKYVIPKAAELLKRHPLLRIEIVSSDLSINMVENGIDVAIRFGEVAGDCVARQVGTAYRIAVAAPAYLERAGIPVSPTDLTSHNCLVFLNPVAGANWTFSVNGRRQTVAVSGNFSANTAEGVREACLNGLGIALMPEWLFYRDLEEGKIERVLQDCEPEGLTISAAFASRKHLPPKIRMVVDFLYEQLSREKALNRGMA